MNNLTPGAIRQFVIGSNGALADNSIRSVGTPKYPGPISFTPNGRFAIASNIGDNTVSSYALSASGSLSLINSVPTGISPDWAVVDSTGKFAYVAASNGAGTATIGEYTIDSNGVLTLIVTYDLSLFPTAMVVSPQGFLYVSEYSPFGSLPGAIVEFSIDEVTGGLSVVNTYNTADNDPGPAIFNPSGTYVYVNNTESLTLSQFSVDTTTGALANNGPDVICGIGPTFGVVDPSGEFLFLAEMGRNNRFSPQVFRYSITSEGTLTPSGTAASLGNKNGALAFAIARH